MPASWLSKDGAARRGGRAVVASSSSLETASPAVGQVTEVNKDTFWPLVKAAGSKIVVLDMYTQWYGIPQLLSLCRFWFRLFSIGLVETAVLVSF